MDAEGIRQARAVRAEQRAGDTQRADAYEQRTGEPWPWPWWTCPQCGTRDLFPPRLTIDSEGDPVTDVCECRFPTAEWRVAYSSRRGGFLIERRAHDLNGPPNG